MQDYGACAARASGRLTGKNLWVPVEAKSESGPQPWSALSRQDQRGLGRRLDHYRREQPSDTTAARRHQLPDSLVGPSGHARMLRPLLPGGTPSLPALPSMDSPHSNLQVLAQPLATKRVVKLKPLPVRRNSLVGKSTRESHPDESKTSRKESGESRTTVNVEPLPKLNPSAIADLLASVHINKDGLASNHSAVLNSKKLSHKKKVVFLTEPRNKDVVDSAPGLTLAEVTLGIGVIPRPTPLESASTVAMAESLVPEYSRLQREQRTKELLKQAIRTLQRMEALGPAVVRSSGGKAKRRRRPVRQSTHVLGAIPEIEEDDGEVSSGTEDQEDHSEVIDTSHTKHHEPFGRGRASGGDRPARGRGQYDLQRSPIKEDPLRAQRMHLKSKLKHRTKLRFLKHVWSIYWLRNQTVKTQSPS